MTVWIRFVRDDEEGQERIELSFNSLMTSVYRWSEPDQIVDGMIANMKFQIENPTLLNSRFVFDEFLYLNINFHQLNLTRDSSYLPLPDWLVRKKAIINPHNDNEECFRWLVITAENVRMKDPQQVSNLRKFTDNYDWSGLELPISIKDIGKFETRNNISVLGQLPPDNYPRTITPGQLPPGQLPPRTNTPDNYPPDNRISKT